MSAFERPQGSGQWAAKFQYRGRQRWVKGGPFDSKESAEAAERVYRQKLKMMARVGRERLRLAEHTPHTVYRYYDEAGQLLYVGITGTAWRRLSEHRRDRSWWPLVAFAEFEHFDGYSMAAEAEQRQIAELLPLFNKRHGDPATSIAGSIFEEDAR